MQVEIYTEMIFPNADIRFIAINNKECLSRILPRKSEQYTKQRVKAEAHCVQIHLIGMCKTQRISTIRLLNRLQLM